MSSGISAPVILSVADNVGSLRGSLANGGQTDDRTLALAGRAAPGSAVAIFDGTVPIGTAVAALDGRWSFLTGALSYATHTFTAQASLNGQTSAASAGFVATVAMSVSLPRAPTITSVSDNVAGGNVGRLTSGDFTNDATLLITGRSSANAVIQIYEGSSLLGSARANSSGVWTFTTGALAEGSNQLSAAVLSNGNLSLLSDFFIANGDTIALAPAITAGMAGGAAVASGGTVTDDNTLDLVGTAEAGSTVNLYRGQTQIGAVTADASGNWAFTTAVLANDEYSFYAVATDRAGNVGAASAAYAVTVNVVPVSAPVILSVYDNEGTAGFLANGGRTDDRTLKFDGSAQAGSIVSMFNGVTLIGTVVADQDGAWTFTTPLLSYAAHTFTATARAGFVVSNASAAFTTTVARSVSLPSAPTISSITDNVAGGKVGVLSSADLTNDATLLISGRSIGGASVRVYDGARLIGTTLANSRGDWTLTTTALADGDYLLSAATVLSGGRLSLLSNLYSLKVDTVALAPGLALAKDTGTAGDGISGDGTVNVSGLEAGAAWQYSTDSGASWQNGSGTSFTLP